MWATGLRHWCSSCWSALKGCVLGEDHEIDRLIAQNAPRVVWLGDHGRTLGDRARREFNAAEQNLWTRVR